MPGVSYKSGTLRFVDSCVYAVGGAFIRRNLCRYTHTDVMTDVYMHPLCIRTCTARVYAPTCGRKRTKHRVQAHTRKRGVGCVNAPIRVYAPFGDATNVMGRNRSNHVGYAPPAPNHLVSPLRHLRLRTISSPHLSGFASPVLGAGLSRSRMIHDARTDRPSSLSTSSSHERPCHHFGGA